MSLRKILSLTRKVSNNSVKFQTTNVSRQYIGLLTANSFRFYSKENIGDKSGSSSKPDEKSSASPKPGEKSDILGRFFPQAPAQVDAEQIKKEQEKFEEENKQKNEENQKSWKRMKFGFAAFGGAVVVAGGCLIVEMGAPRRDDEGNLIRDQFTDMPIVTQYIKRTWKELTFFEKMIKEPIREKLLPDPVPPPYQPKYTLVLEFTDVLVHPDWSYNTGWRFKKRPGVDAFLQTVASSDFEVVIFTSENALMLWPVIDKLDPENKLISYRLFRDSTYFVDGVHVKNLDGLNRDLSKVIMVDWNKQATQSHPQNSLILKKWRGAEDDSTLLDLANLLQTIAMSNVIDVREVLTYYAQFDDPIAAFRENQRKLMEHMEEQERETKSTEQPLTKNWLRTFTRR